MLTASQHHISPPTIASSTVHLICLDPSNLLRRHPQQPPTMSAVAPAFAASPLVVRRRAHPRRLHFHSSPCRMAAAPHVPTPQESQPQHTPHTNDWRAFRAHLAAAHRLKLPAHHHIDTHPQTLWAHSLHTVEPGCILLASPTYDWPAAFAHLRRAVILITDVSDAGLSGLLLNRPTRYRVAEHRSVLARVGPAFAHNFVHLGGDCSTGSLEVLHGVAPHACPGASEIVPGMYRGGFNASRQLVKDGRAAPQQFAFYVAYSRWTWPSFNAEMLRGAWHIASCSPALVVGDSRSPKLWHTIMDMLPR